MGQIHNEDKQCNSFKVSLRKVGQKSYLTKSKKIRSTLDHIKKEKVEWNLSKDGCDIGDHRIFPGLFKEPLANKEFHW